MIRKLFWKILILLFFLVMVLKAQTSSGPYVIVLGITQDGGYPQAGCTKECCRITWENPSSRRHVSCLGIVDPQSKQRWMIDATPDFKYQLHKLDNIFSVEKSPGLDGILITHGHIGHYTGLINLGREVMGTRGIPLYVMPQMAEFIRHNGPWDLLIKLKNVGIEELTNKDTLHLNDRLSIQPFKVPHRGEYTETVGFLISGPQREVLYIPDIDKWSYWDEEVESYIRESDIAYLDATFFADGEIPGRNMADIPHPFIIESMKRFNKLPLKEKNKIRFIHFNHTNPVLHPESDARQVVIQNGFRLAKEEEIENL